MGFIYRILGFFNALNFNPQFYRDIKKILTEARNKAYRAVNFAMVEAYWNIGRRIVEEEQKGKKYAENGAKLIRGLSIKLSRDFGKGFDERNLFYMRQFYLSFPKLNALRSELSWTHYRLLLRVESKNNRDFYIEECAKSHWSTRQLERQINSFIFRPF